MKKLGLVVVVLLIGLNLYGARGYWEDNSSLPATWTNGYVGIGTEYPYYLLDVDGTVRMKGFRLTTGVHSGYVLTCGSGGVGTWKKAPNKWENASGTGILYDEDGGYSRVGIGISPSTMLHVAGYHVNDIGLMELRGAGKAYMTLRSWDGSDVGFYLYDNQTKKWMVEYKNNSRFRFYSNTANEEVMTLSDQGRVGIGTSNPQSKLAVNGTITAKEIEVQLTGWPDFVFGDNYNLMPLNKLEKHIKKEKSLPGISTNKEVEENGVKLGDMQAKLLQKVEELTLYVIEQDKKLSEQNKKLTRLESENKELKEQISRLEK